MSLKDKAGRIIELRDDIRNKVLSLGIITNSSAKLSECEESIKTLNLSSITAPSISITPDMSINNSNGVVSVSGDKTGTISADRGYSSDISKSVVGNVNGSLKLTTQGAQTITPKTYNQTIAANRWLTGAQTVLGDSDLIASNIRQGVSVFGVKGSARTITSGVNSSGKIWVGKSWNIAGYQPSAEQELKNYKVTITGLKRLSGTQDWYEATIYCLRITNLGFTPVIACLTSNTVWGTDYMQWSWMTAWGAVAYRQTSGKTYDGYGMLVHKDSLKMTSSELLIPTWVLSTGRSYTVEAFGYY
jgi:hypothetical protein